MRWLAVLAIAIVGVAVYLKLSMSDGATEPPRSRPSQPTADRDDGPAATSAPVAPGAPHETARAPTKADPAPTLEPTRPIDRIAQALSNPDAGVPIDAEETPWTEQEATGHLFAISGRYEKGNYPGAIEKAMEVARRYPPWREDAYKWAIQAHCAMENGDKASELFATMTDKGAIDEIVKSCTKWGVKLKATK
jgi:hypothetical protein